METIEATAYGTYEIDLFGRVYICNRYIAMATAYSWFNGRHFVWHRVNHYNGTIPKYYNKIWTQSQGTYRLAAKQWIPNRSFLNHQLIEWLSWILSLFSSYRLNWCGHAHCCILSFMRHYLYCFIYFQWRSHQLAYGERNRAMIVRLVAVIVWAATLSHVIITKECNAVARVIHPAVLFEALSISDMV